MSLDLDSFVCVPLTGAIVADLLKRSPHGTSALIENMTTDFLHRTDDELSVPSPPVGLFWESLFLPNGTQTRTKYFGEFKQAEIVDQSIMWEGSAYKSFAQLANAMRGGLMNSAWRDLEIKRPNDKT